MKTRHGWLLVLLGIGCGGDDGDGPTADPGSAGSEQNAGGQSTAGQTGSGGKKQGAGKSGAAGLAGQGQAGASQGGKAGQTSAGQGGKASGGKAGSGQAGSASGGSAGSGQAGAKPGDETSVAACTDGIDNDGNGYTDCGEANCCAVVDCTGQPSSYCGKRETSVAACSDGKDNDGDTYTDCGDKDCCNVIDCQTIAPTSYCAQQGAGGSGGSPTCADPEYPKYCPKNGAYEGGCWTADTSCPSIAYCEGHGYQSCSGPLALDCAAQQCVCPDAAYPQYCPAKGEVEASCWSPGTACSTVTSCDGVYKSCSDATKEVDCETNKCVSSGSGGTGGSGSVDPSNKWLVGYFSRPASVSNNITMKTEYRGLSLAASGTYTYANCTSCSEPGTWDATATQLTLTNQYGQVDTISLTTQMTPNCRVVYLDGAAMWRSAPVAGCPFTVAPLTAEECTFAGTWKKHEEFGSSSSSSSYDDEIELDVDRHYESSSSSFKTTCYQDNCKSLSNSSTPLVGLWKVSGGQLYFGNNTHSLSGYKHTASKSCP